MLLYPSTGQHALLAAKHFSPGDVISHFSAGITQPHADRYTVQIGEDKHITLVPKLLQYINHSCSPCAFFDTTLMVLISLRTIEPGDEITFFYPSTEWEMAEPFNCHCGSPECLNVINGAASLPEETLAKYVLTDFIREMIFLKNSL
ncbi:MAG: SET domain-containing protein-lysine N-methyltransferase [Saprospiraceae bacterium]